MGICMAKCIYIYCINKYTVCISRQTQTAAVYIRKRPLGDLCTYILKNINCISNTNQIVRIRYIQSV